MKKKLLVLVLALCMTMTVGMPAFAAGNDAADQNIATVSAVSEDETVQALYDAFVEMETALADKDLDAMEAALEDLNTLSSDLTDEQTEEWNKVVGEKVGLETFFSVVFDVGMVITAADYYEAYAAEPNAKTAYEYVVAYDMLTEDYNLKLEEFVPAADEGYAEALDMVPSENTISVYDAYAELQMGLESFWYEDLEAAVETFGAVVETFNELTEEELSDLAVLLGVESGEEAFGMIFSDWIDANIILGLDQVYNAYAEDPNAETAQALVEYYDGIFNDPSYEDEALRATVLERYEDLADVYADAKALLAGDTTGADDTDDSTKKSPSTGESASMWMLVAAAAAVTALAAKRRKMA